MPGRIESNSAAVAIDSQESHDSRPSHSAGLPPAVKAASGGAAQEGKNTHTLYYHLYDHKRRQTSGGLLSIGSTTAAVVGNGNLYESYDRKRRQFTSPHFDLPMPTIVVEEQITPRTGSASPKHRLHAQAPRRSVDYPHVSSEEDHVSYSSGSVSDISTSSISKLPPIEQAGVITGESEIAEKNASVDLSVIPIPTRKPTKAIKSSKALSAKVTPKKATARCRNRIWRC